jgi:deoxyribonuclease-4
MIIDTLNEVMFKDMNTTILIETMSGKGSELGITFEEIKTIIDGLLYKEHIGVTIDTCHIYSAGYDIVNDLDGVIDTFDRVIGLKYLKAIHLNDSMMPFNSRKDRHQKIGDGSIGLDTIIKIINHPKLKDLPFYLETPNDLVGFGKEIQFLKSKREEL